MDIKKRKAYLKNYRNKFKTKAFNVLGNKCIKCGFSDVRALQIDHINGGGFKERKEKGAGGIVIYKRIISNKFNNLYQLLCANCNWIKRFNNNEQRK